MKKVIVIVLIVIIAFIIHFYLFKISFGIVLPFGWDGDCYYYKYNGFPFSEISIPSPGLLCAEGYNFIGTILNYVFSLLLACALYRFLRMIFIRRFK